MGHAHALPELRIVRHHLVRQLLRRDASGCGGLLHLLAVLICAGEEVHLLPAHAVEPGDHIRQYRRIGVPDVGPVIDIVDGRGEVEGLGHGNSEPSSLQALGSHNHLREASPQQFRRFQQVAR